MEDVVLGMWGVGCLVAGLALVAHADEPKPPLQCDEALRVCEQVRIAQSDVLSVTGRLRAIHEDDLDAQARAQSQLAAAELELATRRRVAVERATGLQRSGNEGLIYCARLCLRLLQ